METIGKYRIEEKIGGGGFGEVFKAYDPLIKRHVAIKTCASDDENVADRFYQEAEIGGNLHHRNITTVYDFGVHDGLPYLVQEYLSGEDLDVKIKRRDYLPYTEKLLYLLQIARGLAYAHAQGFIHRDVKPANVRVLEDGTAKIIDFGIAKLAQQESGLTQTGMTLGTAAYLSPEQVRGDRVDARTDIFSFGILAYELLTYQRPFQGEQISTVIYNLLNHEPEPITAHWPGAPPEMVTLVDRCLRKDAGQRFADGAELVRELEKLKKRGRGERPAESSAPRPIASPAVPSAPPATAPLATAAAPAGRQPMTVTAPTAATGGQTTTATHGDNRTGASRVGDSRVGASRLEYEVPPDRLPATGETAAVGGGHSPRSTAVSLAILMVLAAAAAAAGWWLGTRGKPAETGSVETATADTNDPATVLDTEPVAASGEPSQAAEPATIGTSDSTPGSPPEDSSPDVADERPAPPPPAPVTGKVLLPRVPWTDRMSVRLGGNSYGLHRRHTVELPAGTYRAIFELAAEGVLVSRYSPPNRTVEIRVIAGESSTIEVPIPRPGAVSVRPLPGRPQGQVSIDGEALGPTPLSRIQREPGVYMLEILPRDGEGEGLKQEITLESGQETILSFDLDAGTVRTTAKAL